MKNDRRLIHEILHWTLHSHFNQDGREINPLIMIDSTLTDHDKQPG